MSSFSHQKWGVKVFVTHWIIHILGDSPRLECICINKFAIFENLTPPSSDFLIGMLQKEEVWGVANVGATPRNQHWGISLPLCRIFELMSDHRRINSLNRSSRHHERVEVGEDHGMVWRDLLNFLEKFESGRRRENIIMLIVCRVSTLLVSWKRR